MDKRPSDVPEAVCMLIRVGYDLYARVQLRIGLSISILVDIFHNAGVLLGFAAVFFTIGIWRFRYE
jgi:hypothetical protein